MQGMIPDSARENILVEDAMGILLDNSRIRESSQSAENADVLSAAVSEAGWTVSVPTRLSDSDGSAQRIVRICLFFGIGSVALLILLMLVQYRHIVEPIQKLTEKVDYVETETTAVLAPNHGFAELRTLTGSMNGMLSRLKGILEQMLNDRLRYYEDRITFLQAQMLGSEVSACLPCI